MSKIFAFLLFILIGCSTVIGQNYELKVNYKYDEADSYFEGLAGVSLNDKWGFIDSEGSLKIPHSYSEVKSFENGIAGVKKDGNWFFIDKTGKKISELYDKLNYNSNRVAYVKRDGKWGVLDFNMNVLVPCVYDVIPYAVADGLLVIELKDGSKGVNTYSGEELIPTEYSQISYLDGMFICSNMMIGAYFSTSGKQLTLFKYQSFLADDLVNNRMPATDTSDNAYLINSTFEVLNDKFEWYSYYRGDLYFVQDENNEIGIYNFTTNSWFVEPNYRFMFGHEDGFISFESRNGDGVIGPSGKVIYQTTENSVQSSHGKGSVIMIENNYEYGAYCVETGVTIPATNQSAYSSDDGKYITTFSNDKTTVYNSRGEIIAENLNAGEWPMIIEGKLAVQNEKGLWGFIQFN